MSTDAMRRLLEELHPASFGWAMACTSGDREEAEVVLQTACLLALDGKARWGGASPFRTWFFGVVRNVAASRRRRRLLERFFFPVPLEAVPQDRGAADPPDDDAAREVRRALGTLSARQREVLHLVFYEGMAIGEAARTLGLRLGTARTHYERGKARLRRALAPTAGERRP
jgi:RNA polymerase sigma-70 factor (ECF subfamily)